MSLASVRTAIHTTLSAATVLGAPLNTQAAVHDYFRAITTEAQVKSVLTFNGAGGALHAWMVSLAGDSAFLTTQSNRRQGRDPMAEYAAYHFRLYGWYGVRDAVASEKTWADIVEDIFDAFRADKKLGNTVMDSGPLQWDQGGGGEGCVLVPPGTLCHFARLSLPVYEPLGS